MNHRDEGSGPALVLLHGMMLDHSQFDPQADGLKGTCRVIAPDLRSRWADPATVNLEAMATDVLELLDALGLERAIVGGMSLGGYVAQHIAARSPDRVDGIVLIASDVTDVPDTAGEKHFASQRHFATLDPEFAWAEAVAHFSTRTRRLRPELVSEWANAFGTRSGPQTWAETLCWSRPMPDAKEIFASGLPALIIWGEEDECIPLERGVRTATVWSGARLTVLPFAGHAVNLEQPDCVNAAIGAFVEELAT